MNLTSKNTPPTTSLEDYGDILVFTNEGPRGNLPKKIKKDKLVQTLKTSEADVNTIIPSAQILTAFATPVELVPAPGEGKINLPTQISVAFINGDTVYNTSVGGRIRYLGDGSPGGFLVGLGSTIQPFIDAFYIASYAACVNKSIVFDVITANPQAGNYDLWVRMDYKIINAPV